MEFIFEDNRIYNKDESGKLLAEITFPLVEENVVNINHTYVDNSLRGQGIASQLMKAAVKHISEKGWKAIVTCPYSIEWFAKKGDAFSVLK